MNGEHPRPRLSLSRVLDDLGATFLDVVSGPVDDGGEVTGVTIWDWTDPPHVAQGVIVLGVGIRNEPELLDLLRAVRGTGVAAVVLRAPLELTSAVRDHLERGDTCVMTLLPGASWAQLSEMLRSMLVVRDSASDTAARDTLGGLPSGDLFAVANAIAALMDAPVTIEDRSSRVLAFSGRQDEADPSRVETVLGRQVPVHIAQLLSERGVFSELHRTTEPVFIGPLPMVNGELTMPRIAIAVRAGDEVLGSVWAAVPALPDGARLEALQDATKLVALHMLRHRVGSDAARRVRADLLSTSLAGGSDGREALVRLGLADRPLVVVALRPATPPAPSRGVDEPSSVQDQQRLTDAFAMHLAAVQPGSAVASVGGTTFGLLATTGPPSDAEARAERLLIDFVQRLGDRFEVIAAVGPVAEDLSGLARSRVAVERTLRAFEVSGRRGRVGRLADVQAEAMVLEMRDLAAQRSERVSGPLARLRAYDDEHGSSLVDTLREWLAAFGDVAAAAQAGFVHPNTFRYRLRRVAEVGGVDLDDADQRFSLLLQLKVFEP